MNAPQEETTYLGGADVGKPGRPLGIGRFDGIARPLGMGIPMMFGAVVVVGGVVFVIGGGGWVATGVVG